MNRIKKGNKTVTTYRHRVQFVAVVVPPSLLCCSSHARHTPLAPKASWYYFTITLAASMPTGITDHDVRTHFGLHWCLRLSISSSPRMPRCSPTMLGMLRTASWVVPACIPPFVLWRIGSRRFICLTGSVLRRGHSEEGLAMFHSTWVHRQAKVVFQKFMKAIHIGSTPFQYGISCLLGRLLSVVVL